MHPPPSTDTNGVAAALPLAEERLHVETRQVETARVRVGKRVVTHTETIDVPLTVETVEVRRVAVNRVVDAVPAQRQEGGVTIVPVVEERLVVTKQLVLTEEVHIAVHRRQRAEPRQVSLRREELTVERDEPRDPNPPPP